MTDDTARAALRMLTEVDQRLPVGDFIFAINAALDASPDRPSGLLREAAMDALDWWAGQIVKDKADPTGDALFSALRAALAATEPGLDG